MDRIKKQHMEIRQKISERIKTARSMAGYSERKAFCSRFSFPLATLEAWERGKNPLTLKGAKRLVDILREVGIYCSEEWLREGTGISPRPMEELSEGLKEDLQQSPELGKTLRIAKEISTFVTLNEDAVVTIVRDDAMLPFYSKGDYVGGIKLKGPDLREAIHKKCIIELLTGKVLVRQLYEGDGPQHFMISTVNLNTNVTPMTEHNVEVISAAPILWHRICTP